MAKSSDKEYADQLFHTVVNKVEELKERISTIETSQSSNTQSQMDVEQIEEMLAQAISPISNEIQQIKTVIQQNEVTKVKSDTPAPAEASPPPCIYPRNENPRLEADHTSDNPYGIMSDEDYLYQVFPSLPQWLTKTPQEHYAMIEERYRDKVIGRMMIKETNDVLTTFLDGFHLKSTAHANQIIAGWKSESDRRGKQYESLSQKVANDSVYVRKNVEELNVHYRKAVQLETLKTRRSGLFIMGRHILPLWFVALITATLLLCTFLASTFAIRTYETNIRLQQELLHLMAPQSSTYR